MTRIYTQQALIQERDNKELGTLYREHVRFDQNREGRKFTPEYTDEQQIINGQKVWANANQFTITMLDFIVKQGGSRDTTEYDYLWRDYDGESNFTDIGRRININWGGGWNYSHGSMPLKNILEEELRLSEFTFFENKEQENEALANGDWQTVAEAYVKYFIDIVGSIMKRYRNTMPHEDARAEALHAICEFAKFISDNKQELNARFFTAAYGWVMTFYRKALDNKDVINMKPTVQKLKDQRTLNGFIKEFKEQAFRSPTIEEICKGTGWGELRVESTFRLFDFHIGYYRDMNTEEMLYTVMNDHLTERQSTILEMSFGLNGAKFTLDDIADELGLSVRTVKYDRAKALEIIKKEISFKFS